MVCAVFLSVVPMTSSSMLTMSKSSFSMRLGYHGVAATLVVLWQLELCYAFLMYNFSDAVPVSQLPRLVVSARMIDRILVAQSSELPESLAVALGEDKFRKVRETVLANPAISDKVKTMIALTQDLIG